MQFVRKHTSVPVPVVLDSFIHGETGRTCIVMEYVEGTTIEDAWPKLEAVQKANIIAQLGGFWDELRSVKGTFIGCIDNSRCEDQFFPFGNPSLAGPFVSEHAFTEGLKKALQARSQSTFVKMISRLIDTLPPHDILLTHNDLAPRNILVRDGNVVAILDWELAGFYPEYWEYVKAHFYQNWQSPWMVEEVLDQILSPYLQELGVLLHARHIIH